MVLSTLILGGGSAGLLAALTLKKRFPLMQVQVLQSREIGIIGVGEGTTPTLPSHLQRHIGADAADLHARAQPTWKLGLRFTNWGPRGEFHFSFQHQYDQRFQDLPLAHGFYCEESAIGTSQASALMAEERAFLRQRDGFPDLALPYAWHLENEQFVAWLEHACRQAGVISTEGKVCAVKTGPNGIDALRCEDGRLLAADLFIDASGFRSELLGLALGEPFIDYSSALFCDRAIVGGWDRQRGPILPYTVCEAMDAGWAWRIEHEHRIHRGYVFSTAFISDDAALVEFAAKNPELDTARTRIIRYRCGRYARSWIGNVFAIGNAAGFVEPLEATALAVICLELQSLCDYLETTTGKPAETSRKLHNRIFGEAWDNLRDFLALHYRFNTLGTSPFWQHCQHHAPLGGLEGMLATYREHGPASLVRYSMPTGFNLFLFEGYLALLIGLGVPYQRHHTISAEQKTRWQRHLASLRASARNGLTVDEALAAIRSPSWRWH